MTSTELALYRSRHTLWIVAILLFLGGAIAVSWVLVDRSRINDQLSNEANLRGQAVSTLAGDVRALRQQVKAGGETPVAPDPTKAVKNLPDRAEVPVPIPGPPGPKGDTGAAGKPAPTITPAPGVSGQPGTVGSPGPVGPQGEVGPVGPAGPQGAQGDQGPKGDTGDTGATGPAPSGWTYTDGAGVTYTCTPDSDGSTHYTCTAAAPTNPTPAPSDTQTAILTLSTALTRRRLDARSSTRGRHRAVRRRGGAHR
jgi:hypothetical protein